MTAFTFNTTPSIQMGRGLIQKLGNIVQSVCGRHILLVTDNGLMDAGLVEPVLEALALVGCHVELFSNVVADPPESTVLAAVKAAKGKTGVIGYGGGSSIDVAKLAALLATSDQMLEQAYGVGNAIGPRLPLIAIPTTAGTGSEVTPISIVTTGASEKMGVVSPWIIPDVAILDPELTIGLPAHVTAATGIDAMVHAIEAYASVSPNNNPISKGLAVQALKLMGPSLQIAVDNPKNIEARESMLLGSLLAGQAFANSPVAAVHALAYPIGGHFKVPHGLSNALVLPHVLRFNAETTPKPYAELLPETFKVTSRLDDQDAAFAFANALADLSKSCGLPQTLRDVGIAETDLTMMAKDAMNQTRLLVNNPRMVDEAAAFKIYSDAW